jgi:hypothetical protein
MRLVQDDSTDSGELVFSRDVSPTASMFDCLRVAWDEAQSEADCAYEAWCCEDSVDAYVVYRAAQDRADAGQDALARHALPEP